MTVISYQEHPLVTVDWLRPLHQIQMQQLVAIEAKCCPEKPWILDDFASILEPGGKYLGRVAICGGRIVGFMIYETYTGGRRVANIAVDPEWQRLRVGSMLLGCLKRQLADAHHVKEIVAIVWEEKLVSQQFFRSNAFRWVETILPNQDGDRTAYVLRCAKRMSECGEEAEAELVASLPN